MLAALQRRHPDMLYFYTDLTEAEVNVLQGSIVAGMQYGRKYWATTGLATELSTKRITT